MKFLAPVLALFLALVTTQADAAVRPGLGVPIPIPPAANQSNQTFTGTFTIKDFRPSADNQGIVAVGVIAGTVTQPGQPTKTVLADLTVPVKKLYSDSGATAAAITPVTCPILHLDLGPIDLTLLGLNITVSEIIVDITATQGGGLLGNLLCSIANLLNSGPLNQILNQLVALLNQLLGALG